MLDNSRNSYLKDSVASLGLHTRIWLRVMAGLVLTGLIAGVIFTYLTYRSQSEQLLTNHQFEMELQSVALKSEFSRLKNLAAQVTSRSRIRQELEKYQQGKVNREELIKFTSPKLADALRQTPDMLGISRLDKNGQLLIEVGKKIPVSSWPENYMNESIQTGIPVEIDKQPVMVVSAPIQNRQGEKVGIDLVVFSAQRINAILNNYTTRFDESGRVQLVRSRAGETRFYYQPTSIPSGLTDITTKHLTQDEHDIDSHAFHILNDSHSNMIVLHQKVEGTGWYFIYYENSDIFYAPARSSAVYVAVTVVVLTLIGILLTLYLVRPLAGSISVEADSLRGLLQGREVLLDKVQQSEARLQSILENTTSVVYVKGVDGKYQLVNQRYLDLFGLSHDDIIGKYDHDIFPVQVADKFRENDVEVINNEKPIEFDELVPHHEGEHHYLSIKFPLYNNDGMVNGICCISTDISERKRAEQELADSRERFELAMQASSDGLWDWDLHTNEVYYSPRWKSMLGYEDHELENHFDTWVKLVNQKDKEKTMALVEECIAGHRDGFSCEFRMWHKSGGWVYILARGILVRNDAGQPVRMVGTHVDINQQKELEKKLRDSEVQANLIIDTAPDAMIMVDHNGVMIRINPKAEEVFGYCKEDMLGQPVEMLLPASQKVAHEQHRKDYMKNPHYIESRDHGPNIPLVGQDMDGHTFPVEAGLSPVMIGDKQHVVVTLKDISERIAAEKALQDSDKWFRTLFDLSPDPAWIIEGHRFVECNQAAVSILGYQSKADLLNMHPSKLSPKLQPDGQESFLKAEGMMMQAHEQGMHRFEWVHSRADGKEFYAEVTLSAMELQDRNVIYCAWRDITDRKKAEDELSAYRENLEQLVKDRTVKLEEITAYNRTLFEKSPIGLVLCDMEGTLVDVNPAFLDIIGYTEAESKMLTYWEVTPRDYEANEAEQLKSLEETSHYGPYEKEYIHKEGHRVPVLLNGLLIERDGKQYIWSSVEDITQRKAQELRMAEARQAAEVAARAKSEFLANMSHEIRTPLNGVLGLARIGERGGNLNTDLPELFGQISTSGNRLLRIVNDILDFSKIEAGKMVIECKSFNLRATIDNTVSLLRKQAEDKELSLNIDMADDLPRWVKGDQLRLDQILMNLLSNAIKFTEIGGVKLKVSRDGEDLLFQVQDTGIGMFKEQLEQLFTPFEQADSSTTRRFGGTGLGLTISQNLAQLMKGNIIVDSEPSHGSTFYLRLPLPETSEENEQQSYPVIASGSRLNGIRILAVEDIEVNRLILQDVLEYEGADVVFAENGQQALDCLGKRGLNAFDIVLMDVQMPVMDGYMATRCIRKIIPELPVIGLTAHAMSEERNRCLDSGMVEHITKPINSEELVGAILRFIKPATESAPRLSAVPDTKPEPAAPTAISNDVADTPPEHLPGIDLEDGLKRMRGRWASYKKLLLLFYDEYNSTSDQLDQLLEDKKLEEAAILTHSLKGVSGTLGAWKFHEVTKDLEQICRAGDLTTAKKESTNFRTHLEEIIEGLTLLHEKKSA